MKKMKAVLSVVLSVVLLVTTVPFAFAANGKCDCGTAPIVQVRGIGETLYDGEGNEVFSAGNIVSGILPVLPELAQFLVTMDTDVLVDALGKECIEVGLVGGHPLFPHSSERLVKAP